MSLILKYIEIAGNKLEYFVISFYFNVFHFSGLNNF